MPIKPSLIEDALRIAFPTSKFKLEDIAGDNDHYELSIALPAAITDSLLAKHKIIYHAIKEHVGELPHALSINIINEEEI